MPAYYFDTFKNHQNASADDIIGKISLSYSAEHLNQKQNQTKAWADTIEIFKNAYTRLLQTTNIHDWGILYEYRIPRRDKKIDVVLIANHLIFVVEVKSKQKVFLKSDKLQLEDYALDLRDFHDQSKNRTIVPILLCTEANDFPPDLDVRDEFAKSTMFANRETISKVLEKALHSYSSTESSIVLNDWNNSIYSPTPTIIEAAQTLYAGQSAREISSNKAGAENLTKTCSAVLSAIQKAQQNKTKVICFITGVPGSGKTLAGLDLIHNPDLKTERKEIGVFLSGNSPLVKVLCEALARDYVQRTNAHKLEARRKVRTFIQNVHQFIDDHYFNLAKLPIDRVLVYDEAQRAWNKEHKSRKSEGRINASEPDILMSIIMDRFPDWAVIIALVGGGQEINTGEGGLREWGKTLEEKFSHWEVNISGELKQQSSRYDYTALFDKIHATIKVSEDEDLHLSVSLRSYKASQLSTWVSHVMALQRLDAKSIYTQHLKEYPIFITRDFNSAKKWLRGKSLGLRRTGLVASSGGRRLRAHGYDPYYGLRGDSTQEELGAWYINPIDDVRSSNFLEILATEYAVQGLEVDWAGILWDCDLRISASKWMFYQFKGTKWQRVSDSQRQQFVLNKYRVLLTRAREGFVICVPPGSADDQTRLPAFYNETFDYLKQCGIPEI